MSELIRFRSRVALDQYPQEVAWEDAYNLAPPIEYLKRNSDEAELEWYAKDENAAHILAAQLTDVPFLGILERQVITSDDWQSYWKTHFHTKRVGEHIVLVPEWEVDDYQPQTEDCMIIVRPGLGFGTGEHFTTSFCLAAIEKYAEGYSSFADVGTGCGILAVAAVKHGFSEVLAFDHDKLACDSARDNFELNGVAQKIQMDCCDLADMPPFEADLVCANLYDTILIHYAELLSRTAKSILVCTGIRAEKAAAVKQAFTDCSLTLVEESITEEWCGLVFSV